MEERRDTFGTDGMALLLLALCGGIFAYWTVVPRMVGDWWADPNFSHGFLVPVLSGWLIWERRQELRLFPDGESGLLGLILVGVGALLLVVGKAGGEYFSMRISMVFVIAGIFQVLFGTSGLRNFLFPLAFLAFMVPLPYILYDAIAFPLKLIASALAEHLLDATGIPVLREGNIIHLPNMQLEVADACSGIRSLMSLLALSLAGAHFLKLGLARGALLFLSAAPVSVMTNSLRIFVTGVLSNRYGARAAEGFFHEFSGWVLFLLGAFLIVAVGLLLAQVSKKGTPAPGGGP